MQLLPVVPYVDTVAAARAQGTDNNSAPQFNPFHMQGAAFGASAAAANTSNSTITGAFNFEETEDTAASAKSTFVLDEMKKHPEMSITAKLTEQTPDFHREIEAAAQSGITFYPPRNEAWDALTQSQKDQLKGNTPKAIAARAHLLGQHVSATNSGIQPVTQNASAMAVMPRATFVPGVVLGEQPPTSQGDLGQVSMHQGSNPHAVSAVNKIADRPVMAAGRKVRLVTVDEVMLPNGGPAQGRLEAAQKQQEAMAQAQAQAQASMMGAQGYPAQMRQQ